MFCMSRTSTIRSDLILMLAAIIWGFAFIHSVGPLVVFVTSIGKRVMFGIGSWGSCIVCRSRIPLFRWLRRSSVMLCWILVVHWYTILSFVLLVERK